MSKRDSLHTGFYSKDVLIQERKARIKNVFPGLAKIIPKNESIIDLGSAVGRYVKGLRELGYTIDGVDGAEDVEEISGGLVTRLDLTKSVDSLKGKYDWGLFSEVGEHVPVELEKVLIDNVCSIPIKGLIVSWADPTGSKKRGHINCRELLYVALQFSLREWQLVDIKQIHNRKFLVFKKFRK